MDRCPFAPAGHAAADDRGDAPLSPAHVRARYRSDPDHRRLGIGNLCAVSDRQGLDRGLECAARSQGAYPYLGGLSSTRGPVAPGMERPQAGVRAFGGPCPAASPAPASDRRRFSLTKAQAMDRQVARARAAIGPMPIPGRHDRSSPGLLTEARRRLQSISRASFYHELRGETARNLGHRPAAFPSDAAKARSHRQADIFDLQIILDAVVTALASQT